MDTKEFLGLVEAYAQVHTPQREEFESWVDSLIEEGYDLSDYTWDEMYDIYLDEAEGSYGRTPKATAAYGKLSTARRSKPASEYSQKGEKTKKVKSAEKHFNRSMRTAADHRGKQSTPPSRMVGRGKMNQDSRDWARESDVEYGAGGNTHGSGTVTKSAKKLRKQKALGEIGEGYDIFDVVLEFLQAEGYVETLEEAEWMMANIIDEEAIEIILGEEQLDEISQKTATKAYATSSTGEFEGADSERDIKRTDNLRRQIKRKFGDKAAQHADRAAHSMTFGRKGAGGMPPKPTKEENVNEIFGLGGRSAKDRLANSDYMKKKNKEADEKAIQNLRDMMSKDPERQKRPSRINNEAFEAWLDEAMSNYEKNRKRAAQRAAARNAARDQGKTGAVPGVGYVTPRRESEYWTDESGKKRHAKGL